jgi:hypothetical protein
VCVVGMGGVLLMRPLLLHASSPSRVPKHRRVVHLDFASMQLPNGMRWLSELNELKNDSSELAGEDCSSEVSVVGKFAPPGTGKGRSWR